MRISDWSSDVCSSDLLVLGGVRLLLHQVDRAHHHAGRAEAALQAVMLFERRLHRMQLVAVRQALARGDLGAEIGRASGRVRVCQVRVAAGGRRILKTKKPPHSYKTPPNTTTKT